MMSEMNKLHYFHKLQLVYLVFEVTTVTTTSLGMENVSKYCCLYLFAGVATCYTHRFHNIIAFLNHSGNLVSEKNVGAL